MLSLHNPATFRLFSQDQVEKCNRNYEDAKLDNVSLLQGDILNFDESLETLIILLPMVFYSWISDEMKDKLFDIRIHHLADNGIT